MEAGLLKSVTIHLWAGKMLRYLDARVLVPRRGSGVNWAERGGGARRLTAGEWVYSVSPHGRGLVCGGLHDGSIRVWNRATLEVERTLPGTGRAAKEEIMALASVDGWLVSASSDSAIRVWDVATGRCERTLAGHADEVLCLAVCAGGGRLVSGSTDRTARVWETQGAVSTWRCAHTLAGHGSAVRCLAATSQLGGKVASGSGDGTIRVWDVGAGTHERTLAGHKCGVAALVACGQRLISSSQDKTVKVWSMATWACVQTVQAYPAESIMHVRRLAVSGSTLVGGSSSRDHMPAQEYDVLVWDLETLAPLHTLGQAAGDDAEGLVSDGGEVWGAVGKGVTVWGRRG